MARNLPAVCLVHDTVPVSCENGGCGAGAADDASGMYGTILLHEGAGGYVLAGVISFTAAVVITALCIKLRERERHRKDIERDNTPQQQEDKTE